MGTDIFAKNLLQAVIEHRPASGKEERRGQNLELLKLAIDENPEYIRNIRQLGMEFYSRHEWAQALPHLKTYLESHQADRLDRSETLVHIALCEAMLGRYEEAVGWFNEAEKIAPDRREVLYHRGVALIKGCYLDQAVEALEKCLTIPVSSKPDFHLNVEGVWDGSAVLEALEFAKAQIAEAKAKWAAQQAQTGKGSP
jgi:tetratricopeptide (TPR) repeat protein